MPSASFEPRPTWELVDLFPHQGSRTSEDYPGLDTNKPIEFTDGYLPGELHQRLALFIHQAVSQWLRAHRGVAWVAPFRVRIDERRFREPDVCVLLDPNDPRRGDAFWTGADVVFEVVSPDNPERDYWRKRGDYAAGGIGEYWIIDPQLRRITVLVLAGDSCREHGAFGMGDVAASPMMSGFALDVSACFTEADRAVSRDG